MACEICVFVADVISRLLNFLPLLLVVVLNLVFDLWSFVNRVSGSRLLKMETGFDVMLSRVKSMIDAFHSRFCPGRRLLFSFSFHLPSFCEPQHRKYVHRDLYQTYLPESNMDIRT
jgi:hypothetical protein